MRFVIVGTSGSGKSTFGRSLAAVTSSSFVELDELHWAENWIERSDSEFAEAVHLATQGERWVVDGNYSAVRHVLWPRATHVVWLNFSRTVVFSRIVLRTLRRSLLKERLWHGNQESLLRALFSRESVILWSLATFTRNRRKYAALRSGHKYRHLDWTELTTTREAEAFLVKMSRIGAYGAPREPEQVPRDQILPHSTREPR